MAMKAEKALEMAVEMLNQADTDVKRGTCYAAEAKARVAEVWIQLAREIRAGQK